MPKGYALLGSYVRSTHPESIARNILVVTGWLGGDRYQVVQKWYKDKYPHENGDSSMSSKHFEIVHGC
jgi:hypothetical protein